MRYVLNRTARALLTLWIALTLAFVLIRRIPGDPRTKIREEVARSCQTCSQAQIQNRVDQRVENLLVPPDLPLHDQYLAYIWNLFHGQFGWSILVHEQVTTVLGRSVPYTLFVMTTATIMVFALAIVWGAVIAYQEGSYFDSISSGVGMLTATIPSYVLAFVLLMIFAFGITIKIPFLGFAIKTPISLPVIGSTALPTGGKASGYYKRAHLTLPYLLSVVKHAILPMASVVLTQTGLWALSMRGNSIQVLGEDYVRVARLRGLADRRIATRYVARNAILPMYTGFLTLIGYNLGASIIIEEVFEYEGMGYYMFHSLTKRDYALIMGTFLVYAVALILAVYIADLTYGYIDPRVKSGESSEAY